MSDTASNGDEERARTAAECGWHLSRYNLMARISDSENMAVFNTATRTCGKYSPIELFIVGALDEVSESHPLIPRLAKSGVIVNYDEREAYLLQRRIECATPPNGKISVTICPTMACNFECPYCFSNLGRGKMSSEVQDDVVALVGRMLDAAAARTLTITWFGGEPLNTVTPDPGDKCYDCEWLPLCGGGCPQLRLFGNLACPSYRFDPERFVLTMYDRLVQARR